MARTEYARTSHQTLLKWIMYLSFIIGLSTGLLGIVYRIVGEMNDHQYYFADLCLLVFPVLNFVALFTMIFLQGIVVDEDSGIIFNPRNKDYTIKIDQISYIRYVRTEKGKIRGIFIHGPGYVSLEVHLKESKTEALAEHLLRLNPEIEVKSGRTV